MPCVGAIILYLLLCLCTCNFLFAQKGPPKKASPEKWGNPYLSMTMGDFGQQNTFQAQALSWITGTLCCDTFLPPGEVADYFGFQYFRDSDGCGMGHNSNFAMYAANALLNTLNDTQRHWLLDLAYTEFGVLNVTVLDKSSASSMVLLDQIIFGRIPLQMAFRNYSLVMENMLNIDQVIEFSQKLYVLDSYLMLNRVQVFARIIKSLNSVQIKTLMSYGCMLTWPTFSTDTSWNTMNGNYVKTLYQTYAGELFAWFKCSKNSSFADPYFAPERQADYFGLFYVKDINAVSTNALGVATTISSQLTGDLGASMYSVLNSSQKKILDTLVQTQRSSLSSFYYGRSNITSLLREYLKSSQLNKTLILSFASLIGKYDGIMAYSYAVAFNKIKNTLNSTQSTALQALRAMQNLPNCNGSWYFSWNEAMPMVSPELVAFFFSPSGTGTSFLNSAYPPAGTISVTMPSIFSSFVAGDNVSVIWSASHLANSFVNVYLFCGPSMVQTLSPAQGTPAIIGSFVGNLGAVLSSCSVYRIKVADASQPTTFGFSSQFAIAGLQPPSQGAPPAPSGRSNSNPPATEHTPPAPDSVNTFKTGFSMKLSGVTVATLQNPTVNTHIISKFAQHFGVSPGQMNMTVAPGKRKEQTSGGSMLVVSVSDLTAMQLANVNASLTLSTMTKIISTADPALANAVVFDIQGLSSIPRPASPAGLSPPSGILPTQIPSPPPKKVKTGFSMKLNGIPAATLRNSTVRTHLINKFAQHFGVSPRQLNMTVTPGKRRELTSGVKLNTLVVAMVVSDLTPQQAANINAVLTPAAMSTLVSTADPALAQASISDVQGTSTGPTPPPAQQHPPPPPGPGTATAPTGPTPRPAKYPPPPPALGTATAPTGPTPRPAKNPPPQPAPGTATAPTGPTPPPAQHPPPPAAPGTGTAPTGPTPPPAQHPPPPPAPGTGTAPTRHTPPPPQLPPPHSSPRPAQGPASASAGLLSPGVNTEVSMKLAGATAETIQNSTVISHIINKFAQQVGVSPTQVNVAVNSTKSSLVMSMMVSDLTPQQVISVQAVLTTSAMKYVLVHADPALAKVSIIDLQVSGTNNAEAVSQNKPTFTAGQQGAGTQSSTQKPVFKHPVADGPLLNSEKAKNAPLSRMAGLMRALLIVVCASIAGFA